MTAETVFRNRHAWILPLCLLTATIVIFEITDLDMTIQRMFYSETDGWLIHFHKHSFTGFCYYTFPNILLGTTGAGFLFYVIYQWFRYHILRYSAIYVIICMIFIPTFISFVKSCNSMPYPSKITEFGGQWEKHSIIQAFNRRWHTDLKRYRGWPAGHASGSSALVCLAFALRGRRRWLGFIISAAGAAVTGFCHTVDGNHFISHNLVTFFLAWLIAALLYKAMLAIHRKIKSEKRRVKSE